MRRLFTEIIFTLRGYLETFGASQLFLLRVLSACPYALARPQLVIKQVYGTGVLSLVIIILSGFFVGLVLALQGFNTLSRFGAEETLGAVAALALGRELGPVVRRFCSRVAPVRPWLPRSA